MNKNFEINCNNYKLQLLVNVCVVFTFYSLLSLKVCRLISREILRVPSDWYFGALHYGLYYLKLRLKVTVSHYIQMVKNRLFGIKIAECNMK